MGKKSRPYPGRETERQFTDADIKDMQQNIYAIMHEHGVEEGSFIVADFMQWLAEGEEKEKREQEKSLEKKEKEKNKLKRRLEEREKEVNELKERIEKEREGRRVTEKRKSALKITAGFLVFGIVLTYIFEWIGNWKTPWEFLGAILVNGPLLTKPVLALFKGLKTFRTREEGEGIGEGMEKCLKDVWQQLKKESGMQILIGVIFVTLLANCFAQVKPFECAKVFCTGGYVALAGHTDDNNNITDDPQDAGEYLAGDVISYEMKQYLTGSDEVLIRQLDKARVTGEQKNLALNLADDDYFRVFFCEKMDIEKYEPQEQLNVKVQAMVGELRGEQRDNVFDREPGQGGAPQPLRDSIGQVSDEEDEWNSFSEVEERLNLRESTNDTYPKRTLTQLVANDYEKLALLLVWYGGEQSTIIYYYGQSILRDFECLKYAENTDRLIKEKLGIIARKYEDIAYVCPDSVEAGRARSLAAAFRYVADQY